MYGYSTYCSDCTSPPHVDVPHPSESPRPAAARPLRSIDTHRPNAPAPSAQGGRARARRTRKDATGLQTLSEPRRARPSPTQTFGPLPFPAIHDLPDLLRRSPARCLYKTLVSSIDHLHGVLTKNTAPPTVDAIVQSSIPHWTLHVSLPSRVRCGCALWVCVVGVRCGCALWMCVVRACACSRVRVIER